MARRTRKPKGEAEPAWDKVAVPEEWARPPYETDYRWGYIHGWRSPRARWGGKPGWPQTAGRKQAWEAGKKAGVEARKGQLTIL